MPLTAFETFAHRDGCNKLENEARKAFKHSLLIFLQEWRAYLNQHGDRDMPPQKVVDLMIGAPKKEPVPFQAYESLVVNRPKQVFPEVKITES